jgi:hypothetical protein
MIREDIERRFTYHPPKDNQPEKYLKIRESIKSIAYMLIEECPESCELDKAVDKLEQVVFYANAAISRN